MAAMFFNWSKFREQFLKNVTQGTIWQAVSEEKNFEEFLWSPPIEKSLPPWRLCFSTDQNFANNFWKGSHKEQSCEIIPNSDQRFWTKKFLHVGIVQKVPPPPPPPPYGSHVFRRIKISRTVFEKFASNWPSELGGVDVYRNCWRPTTDDGHWVILKAPLEHVVLRWAKKEEI